MAFAFRRTQIPYHMFDIERSAAEAKRYIKCERIYHRGQEFAWDGKDILAMLMDKHGGIHIEPDKRDALKRIFAIIMWGEMAAWRIAAQLADGLLPLEAKMAATSQAHDEARHFYVMHDYLRELGYVPARMDRAPQALLDVVLRTDNLAYKLIGMQLLIEPLALTIFQAVREAQVDPVLSELLTYFERDEARHVGLGMQYLPMLMKGWKPRQVGAMLAFQVQLMYWALMENKLLEKDWLTLGIEPRVMVERGRRKQLAVLSAAFDALGWEIGARRSVPVMVMNGVIEMMFPPKDSDRRMTTRLRAAWTSMWKRAEHVASSELDVHHAHVIRTARGDVAHRDFNMTRVSDPKTAG